MRNQTFCSTRSALLALFLSLGGQTGIAGPLPEWAGRWISTGPDPFELRIDLKGNAAEGSWTLPYDADGKPARLTLTFQGQVIGHHLKGPYQAKVSVVGQPDVAVSIDGTAELVLQDDAKHLRATLTVPGENGETQKIEFRRF